jgi:hypothetical protein
MWPGSGRSSEPQAVVKGPTKAACTLGLIAVFIKERARPGTGSVPDLLHMFEHELRFYREIAPEVGARAPECYEAVETGEGFRLVLEDLSS